MRNIELKPCPFCGSIDIGNVSSDFEGPSYHLHAGDKIFAVNCEKCGASVPNRYKNELVVQSWNRRDDNEIASLKAAVAHEADCCESYKVESESLKAQLAEANERTDNNFEQAKTLLLQRDELRAQLAECKKDAERAKLVKDRDLLKKAIEYIVEFGFCSDEALCDYCKKTLKDIE